MATPPDSESSDTLWLISHESEDPMRLTMRELAHEDAAAELERTLRKLRDRGFRVDPVERRPKIDVRYQVFNDAGWLATYWLSPEAAENEGILTAVASPMAQRKTHVRIPLH